MQATLGVNGCQSTRVCSVEDDGNDVRLGRFTVASHRQAARAMSRCSRTATPRAKVSPIRSERTPHCSHSRATAASQQHSLTNIQHKGLFPASAQSFVVFLCLAARVDGGHTTPKLRAAFHRSAKQWLRARRRCDGRLHYDLL